MPLDSVPWSCSELVSDAASSSGVCCSFLGTTSIGLDVGEVFGPSLGTLVLRSSWVEMWKEITWSWLIPHIILSALTVCATARSNRCCPSFESSVIFSLNLQNNNKINSSFRIKSNCASKWKWLVARVESTGSSGWKFSILPAITLFRMLLGSCFT